MALRLGIVQDAFLDAGTSPELARQAAEEIAAYETRMASIDTKLSVLTTMVGTLIGLVLLVLSKVW